MSEQVRSAPFAALDPRTLYDLLALRSAVFVVEQDCVYLDPDGRDVEPTALHWWATVDDVVVATIRVLRDENAWRIGRVVTARSQRSTGVASRLMQAALAPLDGVVVLDAQSHLADWYRGFGFEPDGAEFIEDGIPHVPMRRVLS